MRWNQWRKRCILACIGGTVFWGSMAGINTVSAVTAGYMADGGHINSTSNVILYQDANGTYELSDQSASKGKTDNSEAVGNVAAGNFSQAGSEANYESYNIQIYRETTNPWAGVTHNGKKYDWNGSVDLVKKGNDYYCDTGAKDGEGNVLYAKFDFATMAPNPDHAGWKSGKDLGFSGGITNNVAVGNHAVTKSSSSVAIGDNSSSQGYRSVAVGADSQAGDTTDTADHNDGISAVAVGDGAKAMGNGSIATGKGAHAYGYASVAHGANAGANTTRSIAIGENAAVGYRADAVNDPQRLIAEQAIAIGYNSEANGKDATAVGRQAVADRRNSSSYGNNSHANAYNSVAIGNKSIAGLKSETDSNPVAGQSAVAVGNRATATAEYTTAVGASTYASGWHAVAVGDSNRATGRFSTAMGAGWSDYTVNEDDNDNTERERVYKHIGANQAAGDYSTAVGYGNAVSGQSSSAFGRQNAVSGENSVGIGGENIIGNESNPGDTDVLKKKNTGNITGFAFGHNNKVTGQRGLAGGESARVMAEDSIALGTEAQATLARSVALGSGATTNEVIGTSVVEIPGTNETYSNISGTEPVGTVSVGDKGKERTITNVAAGRIGPGSTDAVNGSELYAVSRQVGINVQNISDLNNRINKVGAGAAALAGLHPLDFDPDEKWDFAVGYGHYRGENAAAIGAFYRPNEDTMFNIAGTIGNGNDMVSAGLSIKVGQANHVSVSRVAMAKEIIELRKALEDQRSFIADSVAGNVLDLSKIQLFPDTPENHWAYDYVATLAGNGILEGYPDGYFKGTRPMTRYEMAAVLYRAMLRGVRLKEKALREFAPELDRIRVDTITKHKDGSSDIQRVRTIKGRGC